MQKKQLNVVVFDMDETLGHFEELGIFFDTIEQIKGNKLSEEESLNLMNLYPEFFRPHIFKILNYLKNKKIKGQCNKIFIYTNNQGPKKWALLIKKFIEKKIKYNIFDKIIAAYKVNNIHIEKKRTTHDKTLSDFLSCTNLPHNTKICFLDDLYHPDMDNESIYYINVIPYKNGISYKTMAERYVDFLDSRFLPKGTIINFIINYMIKSNYNLEEYSNEELKEAYEDSEEIYKHLKNFFRIIRNNKTKKIIK